MCPCVFILNLFVIPAFATPGQAGRGENEAQAHAASPLLRCRFCDDPLRPSGFCAFPFALTAASAFIFTKAIRPKGKQEHSVLNYQNQCWFVAGENWTRKR